VKAYIANGCVLHAVDKRYDMIVEIDGKEVKGELPQAIGTGEHAFKAWLVTSKLDHYEKDSNRISIEEYEKRRGECLAIGPDENGVEYVSLEKEFEWRKFSEGLEPVHVEARVDEPVEAINFTTVLDCGPHIKCIKSFDRVPLELLEKGMYFTYEPDAGILLAEGAKKAGLDPGAIKHDKNDLFALRYSSYKERYPFDRNDCLGSGEYISLDEARARQARDEKLIHEQLLAMKARYFNKKDIPAGEAVREIEHIENLVLDIKTSSTRAGADKAAALQYLRAKKKEWSEGA